MDTPAKVLRSRAHASSGHCPKRRYWNAQTESWGGFDGATRYSPDSLPATLPAQPVAGTEVAWMDDLPRDMDGYPYIQTEVTGLWRVSLCCAAMAGIDDGPLYCKSCYEDVDLAVDAPARLDANWNPGDGPIRVSMPGT